MELPKRVQRNDPGIAKMDTEHELQLGLLHAFEEAVRKDDLPSARRILEQMVDLAEVHFLAEELLMRLHHYPGFDDHAREHCRLLEELGSIKLAWAAGHLAPTLALAEQLKRSLTDHLQGPDHAQAAYLSREGISVEDPHTRI
jgi:hemerythrin-like metal-binding protein